MDKLNLYKDKFGVKYKYPNRSCKRCIRYPCFDGIDKCRCDFAQYGCIDYNDNHRSQINKL